MKTGDKFPVTINGAVVQQAEVVRVDTANSQVTLVIPATEAIMSYRTELETPQTDTPPADTSGTETLITGVDRVNSEGEVVTPNVDAQQPAAYTATAAEPVEVANPTGNNATADTSDVKLETQEVPAEGAPPAEGNK